MVTVGTSVIASKVIGADVEPFLATALRHALALPVLIAMWAAMRLPQPVPKRRDMLLLAAQAAAGSVGYAVLLIHGTRLASAADAGVVAGTLPAMAALFSIVFLRERPTRRVLVAIACATVGVMLLAWGEPQLDATAAGPAAKLTGILLVLAAVACEAFFILGQKRLSAPLHPVAMSTLMCAGGLVLSAVPALMLWPSHASTFTASALAGIAWYAWVPTVIGFLLWHAGANRSTGSQAALATVCLPITALLLAAAFLGESIQAWQWAGLGAVMAAVTLASRR